MLLFWRMMDNDLGQSKVGILLFGWHKGILIHGQAVCSTLQFLWRPAFVFHERIIRNVIQLMLCIVLFCWLLLLLGSVVEGKEGR